MEPETLDTAKTGSVFVCEACGAILLVLSRTTYLYPEVKWCTQVIRTESHCEYCVDYAVKIGEL